MGPGVEIMLVGMSTVFAFLTLLVGLMYASAAIFAGVETAAPEQAPAPAVADASETALGQSDDIAIVLAVAEAWRRRSDGEEAR